jgi:hypothetical protein
MYTFGQWLVRNSSAIQTFSALFGAFISSFTFIFVVFSLRATRKQAITGLEAYREGMRPLLICENLEPEYNFVRAKLRVRNLGKGAAIDLSWQYKDDTSWRLLPNNVLAPDAFIDIWIPGIKALEVGISVRYRSLPSKEDIFTDCKFSESGSSYNDYMLETSEMGRQRQGWLRTTPELSQPSITPIFLSMMTRRQKLIFFLRSIRHGKTF